MTSHVTEWMSSQVKTVMTAKVHEGPIVFVKNMNRFSYTKKDFHYISI